MNRNVLHFFFRHTRFYNRNIDISHPIHNVKIQRATQTRTVLRIFQPEIEYFIEL